jgi:hypothetical protein
MEGNKSLLAERNALCECYEDLESELAKAHASTTEDIAALEVRIKSTEAHTVDVATTSKKILSNFENELINDLVELHALYEPNVQSIRGLYSPMPEGEPSVADYIRWLSTEVTGLPEVIAGMNKKFVSATVEGTLMTIAGSIKLDVLQASTADSGENILPVEQDVRRAACAVSKKW